MGRNSFILYTIIKYMTIYIIIGTIGTCPGRIRQVCVGQLFTTIIVVEGTSISYTMDISRTWYFINDFTIEIFYFRRLDG